MCCTSPEMCALLSCSSCGSSISSHGTNDICSNPSFGGSVAILNIIFPSSSISPNSWLAQSNATWLVHFRRNDWALFGHFIHLLDSDRREMTGNEWTERWGVIHRKSMNVNHCGSWLSF